MPVSAPASPSLLHLLLVLETLFLLAGTALLLLRVRRLPPRFLGLAPSPLAASTLRPAELFLAAAFTFCGAVVFQVAATWFAKHRFPAPEDGGFGFHHVFVGAAFQLGLLAGLAHAWFWHFRPNRRPAPSAAAPPRPAASAGRVLRGGFITFLVALTLVSPVNALWRELLQRLDIEAPEQDLLSFFHQAGDGLSLSLLIALALIVAPVAEELLFRAGLFRWLRTRAPRGVALFVPALAFAMLHGYLSILAPLVVLALVLALGYEHYGHPGVPILAHALFNLNTVALLLAGLSV